MLRSAEDALESAAGNQGMHPTDFRCLGYLLNRNEPVSPRDIIAYLSITSGACTALLDRLETAGYIRRVPNRDDRRSVLILLDETAAAAPLALHRQMSADYAGSLSDMPDASLEAIAIYLERVQRLSSAMNEALYRRTGRDDPGAK